MIDSGLSGAPTITKDTFQIINHKDKPFREMNPKSSRDVSQLLDFLKSHPDFIQESLNEYGGLLLKGFAIKSPLEFHGIANCVDPNLCTSHDFDDGARMWVTNNIYEASLATLMKDNIPLSFHNEDAFVPRIPKTVMLYALEPANFGGETIVADGRKVFASLSPKLQQKFLTRKIKSSFVSPDSTFLVNTRILKKESEIKKLAEKYHALSVERVGGFHTRFSFEVPAVVQHEATAEPIWFSRAHQADLPSRLVDIWYSYRYRKCWKQSLQGVGAAIKTLQQYFWSKVKSRIRLKKDDFASSCTFEDGSKISVWDQIQICRAYWKNAYIIPLKAGDVIILDNRLVTHGRLPYVGGRKLYSCIGSQITVKAYTN